MDFWKAVLSTELRWMWWGATWRIILGLGYVVSKHGDRFRPLKGGCSPSKWPNFMTAINGGDPNYLLSGVILQVGDV